MSLGETFKLAMQLSAKMKAEGVPVEERRLYVEKCLREGWPKGRETPWVYHCEGCSDSGWQHKICTPAMPCGRPFKAPHQRLDDFTGRGRCGPEHTYVVPCTCAKGQGHQRWWEKGSENPDDFTAATKAKPKPKTFSRFGQ